MSQRYCSLVINCIVVIVVQYHHLKSLSYFSLIHIHIYMKINILSILENDYQKNNNIEICRIVDDCRIMWIIFIILHDWSRYKLDLAFTKYFFFWVGLRHLDRKNDILIDTLRTCKYMYIGAIYSMD